LVSPPKGRTKVGDVSEQGAEKNYLELRQRKYQENGGNY
jgi:hypothetical protein